MRPLTRQMGWATCFDKANMKKGPWSPEEDSKLKDYIDKYGGTSGNWNALPHKAVNNGFPTKPLKPVVNGL
ncbi:hypothetical protein Ddye_023201 [Dipteronia dyeriana]|uniref:Myb-like domain-containing protein n=1 Tax=Dipteronia dyeriana TaxID=168575 RepID=A0AAD9TTH7_9ROSI|nr:hypothetical protein Ddye_023201 [Dipteronia dyeriana]